MVPVFEQGAGRGIGISIKHFCDRLESLPEGKKLAVILRDGRDGRVLTLFKRLDIFAKLDRLGRQGCHIFYADDTETARQLDRYTQRVVPHRRVQSISILLATSCGTAGFENVEVHSLISDDDIGAFQEIYEIIRQYIEQASTPRTPWSFQSVGEITKQAIAGFIGSVAAAMVKNA